MNRVADIPHKSVCDQIRTIMKSRNLTQSSLANVAGLHQEHISRILRGAVWPNLATLHAIAGALDCDLEINLKSRTTEISKGE